VTEATSATALSLNQVTEQLSSYMEKYDRGSTVQLLAVSKRKPVSAIREAIQAGQHAFGENYVDEAVQKIKLIGDSKIEWQYIGAIQSRKCKEIAEYFSWAHGVDRLKVASRLSSFAQAKSTPLNICLQVNLDNEASKAGVSLTEASDLALACHELPGIRLRGLMAIPAPRKSFAEQREVFAKLRNTLADLQTELPDLDTLSMGMSADMEAAVAEGATIVRVGTAIFGARDN